MFENDDDLLYLSPLPQPKKPSSSDKVSFYAQKNGVEPEFVRAVMGQESSGNPTAKSWANAKGLLQLTDAVGRKYRKNDYDPYNEDINLDAGTQHLKYLLDKYKGDKKRVLAAYNAGEDNADKPDWYEKSVYWSNDKDVQAGLKPRGPSDKTNTRNYIDKIYGNYEKFRGNQPSSQIEDLSFLSPLANLGNESENLDSLSPLTSTPNDIPPGFQSEPDPEYMAQFSKDMPKTPTVSPTVQGVQTVQPPKVESGELKVDDSVIPPNVPMKQLLDKQGNLPEHIPTLDPKILKTGDGRTLIKHSDQSGLQPGEVRYRNSANDKGGVVILKTDGFGKFFESKPTANLAQNERPVTKQQNLPSSAKEPQFGVSVGVEDFQPIPPNQTDEQPKQQGQPLYEARNNQEILAKGSAKTVPVDLSAVPNGVNKQLYAGREALRQIAANYELTDAEIDSYLAENPNRLPKVTDKNGKEYNSVIDITVQNQVINEILNRRKGVFGNDVQSIEQPTSTNPFLNQLNKDKKAQNAYINPELQTNVQMSDAQYRVGNRDLQGSTDVAHDRDQIKEDLQQEENDKQNATILSNPGQFGQNLVNQYQAKNISESDVDNEIKRRKDNAEFMEALGTNLQQLTANGGIAGAEFAGRIGGGVIGGLGRLADNLGGLARPMASLGLSDQGTVNLLKNLGSDARIISDTSNKNAGIAGDIANMAGGAAIDIPKLVGLTALSGGNAVLAFGLDAATQSAGRGEDFTNITKETAKGLILGAIFHGATKLGGLVENSILNRALVKNGLKDASDLLKNGERLTDAEISGLQKIAQAKVRLERAGFSESDKELFDLSVKPQIEKIAYKLTPNAIADLEKELSTLPLKSQLTARLASEGVKLGTIAGGTFATEKGSGAETTDALKSALLMSIFDLAMNGKSYGELANLSGKVFRVWKDGQPHDILINDATVSDTQPKGLLKAGEPNVEVVDVTGKVKDSDIQAEIVDKRPTVQSETDGSRPTKQFTKPTGETVQFTPTGETEKLGDATFVKGVTQDGETVFAKEDLVNEIPQNQPQRVEIKGKGEGTIIEDRGDKVLVEFNEGKSRTLVRKNQVTPIEETTAPEPEAPETVAAQVESAQHPESPRIGVLYTDGEAEPKVPKGFIRAKVKEGILHINKEKAQEFGLDTSKKVQDFVKENGVSSLIGKVEEVKDTSKGIVVVTTDADTGLELSSSVVSSEENAQKQIEADKESFPGKNHEHQIMTVPESVERRKMNRVALQPKAQNLADNATQNKPVSVNTATNNDSSLTDKKDDSLTGKIEHIANSILATISAKKDAERNLQDIDNHLAEIEQKIQNGENVAYPELLNQKTKGGAAFNNFTLSPDHHVLSKDFADNPLHTIQYLRSRIQQGIEKAQYRNSPEYKQKMTELQIQGIDQQLSDLDTATKTVTMFGKKIQEKLTPAEKEKRKNLLEKEKEKLINQLPKGEKNAVRVNDATQVDTPKDVAEKGAKNKYGEPVQTQKNKDNTFNIFAKKSENEEEGKVSYIRIDNQGEEHPARLNLTYAEAEEKYGFVDFDEDFVKFNATVRVKAERFDKTNPKKQGITADIFYKDEDGQSFVLNKVDLQTSKLGETSNSINKEASKDLSPESLVNRLENLRPRLLKLQHTPEGRALLVHVDSFGDEKRTGNYIWKKTDALGSFQRSQNKANSADDLQKIEGQNKLNKIYRDISEIERKTDELEKSLPETVKDNSETKHDFELSEIAQKNADAYLSERISDKITTDKAQNENIGRTWNGPYGKSKIVAYDAGGAGMYITVNEKGVIRNYGKDIDRVIEKDELSITPEGIEKAKQQREKAANIKSIKEKEAQDLKIQENEIAEFTKGKNPMQAGKIKSTLQRKVNAGDLGIITRKQWIESKINEGYRLDKDGDLELPGKNQFFSDLTKAEQDYAKYFADKNIVAATDAAHEAAPAAEFAKLPENISGTWDVKYLNPPTKTSTGRAVTSFPMVDASTRQKGKNTETRIDSWLIQNAIDEAKSRGDKFNLSNFAGQAGKKLTQADRETAFEYLFSEDWKNIGQTSDPAFAVPDVEKLQHGEIKTANDGTQYRILSMGKNWTVERKTPKDRVYKTLSVSGSQVAMSQYVADAIKQSEKPEIAQDNSDKTSYSGYVANLKTEADNLSQYAGKKIKFNRNGKEVEGTIGNAVNMPNGLYFQHIEDSEGKLLGAVFAKDVEFVEENPTIKEIADASPNVFIVKPGASEPTKTNELPYTAESLGIQPIEEDTWKYFDKKKFDSSGAKLFPLDKLISTKNESLDAKFIAGLKGHPVKNAAGAFQKGAKNDAAFRPRKPLYIADNGDGTYRVLDGNATTQAAKFVGWTQVPAIIADAAKVVELMRNESSFKDATTLAKFFLEGQKPRIQRELAEAAGLNGNASVEEILEATYGKPNAADQLTSEALAKFTDDFKKAEGNAEKQKEISAQLAANLKLAKKFGELEKTDEIVRLSFAVRQAAESEKDTYFSDVQKVAEQVGGEVDSKIRKFLTKTALSLAKKLSIKSNKVPSDLLRTTILIPEGSPAQSSQIAYQTIEAMGKLGYKVWADESGNPDFTNRFEDEAPGYKDINLKFIKGESDPVIKELQLIQPAMAAAKTEGHKDYDAVKDILDELKNNKSLSEEEQRDLTDEMVKLNEKMANAYKTAFDKDVQASAGSDILSSINLPSLTIPATEAGSSKEGLAKRNLSADSALVILSTYTSSSRLSSTERAAKFLDSKVDSDITVSPSTSIITKTKGNESTNQPTDYGAPPTNQNQPTPLDPLAKYSDDTVKDILRLGGLLTQDYKLTHIEEQTVTRLVNLIKEETRLNERSVYNLARQSVSKNNKPTIKNEGENDVSESTTNRGSQESGNSDNSVSSGNSTQLLGDKLPDVSEGVGNSGEVTSPNSSGPILSDVRVSDKRGDGTVSGETGSNGGNNLPTNRRSGSKLDNKSTESVVGTTGNYYVNDIQEFASGGLKTKFNQNVEALETLRDIQREGRQTATPEEQKKLAKYLGWGQFPALFNTYNQSGETWAKERETLLSLINKEEFEAASASTKNAHYTAPQIVRTVWDIVQKLGFKGGRVLETSLGTGNFLMMMPPELRGTSKVTGIELDQLTAQIAKLLFPTYDIRQQGYETFDPPKGYYDLAISNVPFGRYKIADLKMPNFLKSEIHNYFFAKSLQNVRPGGLIAFITSTGTMTSADVTNYLKGKADLVTAVRFPANTFLKEAGTAVVTDLVVLRVKDEQAVPRLEKELSELKDTETYLKERLSEMQKDAEAGTNIQFQQVLLHLAAVRQSIASINNELQKLKMFDQHNWSEIGTIPDPAGGDDIPLNRYYVDNPQNMLGKMDRSGTMYRGNSVNLSRTPDFEHLLDKYLHNLPQNVMLERNEKALITQKSIPAPVHLRQGALIVKDGKVYSREGSFLKDVPMGVKQIKVLEGLLKLRDVYNEVTDFERGGNIREADNARKILNETYDNFVKTHGTVRDNSSLMKTDPDVYRLLGLENFDKKTKKVTGKADIFFQPTVSISAPLTSADNYGDALNIVLNSSGFVDIARIADLMNVDQEQAGRDLVENGLAFHDPRDGWEVKDLYLSGEVRRKLREAKEAAKTDSIYEKNIEALEKVQPEDIPYRKIKPTLGAAWIPASDIKQFMADMFNENGENATPDDFLVEKIGTGDWVIGFDNSYLEDSRTSTEILGTDRRAFDKIVTAAIKDMPIVLYNSRNDGGGIDKRGSLRANNKVRDIRRKFAKWVWADDARRERLHRAYNDTYNDTIETKWDGSHLTFPGMVTRWVNELRPHIKNAVYRLLVKGRMLAAHEVGTGKTSLMIASAMELRRLNLAKKPAIVCLNANVEQVAEAAREMYPNAKILAAYSGMDAHTRKETTTRIMSGDWDIVVLTHDNLQKIPMSQARQLAFINEELEYLRDQVRAAKAAESSQNTGYERNKKGKNQDNRVVKALEAKIATRIAKYQELFAKPKDDVVTFEETGIDFLLVDEAHAFKNLSISTTREGTKGIPTSDAQRATNMFMLTSYLADTHNNRGMAFFTGTPISNTTAEAFNVQRYLQYQDLKARGIEKFDAWAANYGENISTQEMSATGEYKYVTAFRQFKNLETLSGLLRQVMDVVWAADVGAIHRPNKIDHVISVPMSEAQRDFQQTLIERAEKLKSMSRQERKEKGADNWLAIGQHAKWAAIDMRLVDPEAEDDPNSKTNALVREVLEVHRNNPGKTQLIFSNIGVNPNKINPKFHLYGDIIKKLVEGGIPRNKIIDFTKFKSSKTLKEGEEDDGSSPQKEEAMRRLSSGEALVAIGSAEKLGTGVNVQEKVVAMHKLDVKQRPDQDEQETGRGWRHGNENEQVHLYRYTTQDSFDMFFYDRLKQKQNFITSLIKGDVSGEFTDSLDESLDYDTIVALTASDPLIKERVDTMRQLSVLENEFEGFEEDQLRLRDALRKAQNRIKSNEREIADITEDKNAALEKENNRTVKLNDQTFNVESPEEIWDYKNKIAEIETQIREQILADEAKQKHPWTDKKPTEKLIEAKEQYDKELQKQFRAMVKAETDKLGVPEWKKVNKAFSQRLDAYRKQAKEDYWGFGQRLIRNGDEDFGEMFGFPLRVAFSEPWDKTTKEIIMQPYLVMPSGRQAELRTANDLVDKVDKELFNVRIKSTDGLRSEAEIAKSDIPRLEKQLENQFEQKDLLEELRTKLSRIELELGGDVLPEGYQLVEDRIRDLGETKTDEKTDVEYTELEQAAKGFEVGNTKTLGKYARKGQLIIRGENLPETEKKTDLWTDEKTENDIKNTISYFKSGKGKEIVPVAVDLEPDQVLFDNGKWLFARDFAFIHKAFPNAYYLTNNSALMAINNNQVVAVASLFDLRGGLPEDLMPAIRRARFAAEFAKEKRDKLTKLFTEPFRKAQEIKAQKAFGKLLMPSQFDESTFDYAKPEMLYKKRSDQDAAERDRLETVPTHELFDGFAKVDGENVELDLKAAENLRRHIAELSFFKTGDETDESSFDGITLNDGSMKNLIELLQSTYDQALTPDFGYSKKELAGHKSLLDAMKTLAKNQKVGVLYVFDDALPEELFHKLDLLSGRTDETAEQIIMRSPIWKNATVLQFGKTRSFKSEYGNQSTRNRISEVIAKLATGQETRYGLDNGFASREEFEAERDRLIQEWADGVLRKNPNLEKTLEDQIKNYATKESEVEKGDSANSNSNQQINRKESASQKSESDQSGESSAEETESESDRRLPGRSDEVKRRQQAISTPIKFESSGKTKTSQTPETLRENNIDVGDRVYVSTSNIARQTFADAILDEGAESAQQWLDKAVKDKENQSGATVAVAFNLMNHYGKTGDLKNLNKVADDIIPMITDAAQTVQAVSLVNMYNPELAGSYATKVKKQKTGQDITERELAKAQYLANQLQSATNNLVTSQLQNDILTKENETLKTQVADNEKTLSLINKRLLNTKLKMSEIKELYNKVKKQLERLQESRPPKQKLGVPYAKLVKELEDNKQGILDRLQKKFGNNVMLKMVNGNSEHSFLKMVAEPALIKIEQDEVDFVTLKLIDALKNSTTPSDFINDLDNSFNGKLTPFQLQQLHAEAVKRLQNSGQPLSDEQKALAKNNRQHRKIAKEFFNAEQIKADEIKNQFIKNYLKSLKDIKAKNPHLNLISKIVELAQGKDFESESVAVAVSKQEGNDVKTILHKLQEEFDLSEKDAKKVLMQGNALIHQAKQAIEIENKTKKFKIALNEKDLENFKAEQKMLNRQKRQVDFEMRRFYEALSKSTLDLAGDTITGVKRANLLSLPLAIFGKGVAKDFVSTGLFNVTDNLTDAMMIVGDALLSKAQGKDRTIAARLNLNAFKSVFMADETMQNLDKKSGLATAWGILRHGEDIDEAIKKDYIPTDTKALGERLFKEGTKRQRLAETAGGVVDWYIDKVFRTRGMYDAISKVYAFRKSLEQQASVIAKNENLSDEERRSLILNPTNVMQIEAMYYAEEMSFQDDNVVNDYWHSLQAKSKFGKFASNQIIPFAKTVSNVLYRTLQHTPLGFADAARLALVNKEKAKEKIENKYREAVTMDAAKTKNWEQMNKAEQLEYIDNELDKILNRQQKLAIGRAISRGSFGTAGLALGYFLAMAGIMAGALDFDDDKEESARRRKAGIENNSVNFANKFRFSLPETPFGTAMAIGATIADNQKLNTKKRYSTVNPFIDAVGESFYEQAKSLPQVRGTLDFLDNQTFPSRAGTFFAPYLTPSWLSEWANIDDTKDRTGKSFYPSFGVDKFERKRSKLGEFGKPFAQRLPGLRQKNAEIKNQVNETERGGFWRKLIRANDPLNVRSAK